MKINDCSTLTKKIKLVIWDLDETFWKGTLSEEGIEIIEKNLNIVKNLTDRGIMNSIASKNDYDAVKEVLIGLNLWDYFIFPCIDFSSKGEMITGILEKTRLRAENILFIDDNPINSAEAKFYHPELNVAGPEFTDEILTHESFLGKDDKDHSRLKQYKILENKEENKKSFSSNTEFLIKSNIKVEIIKEPEKYFDRIFELIERTNQLNFTKKRVSESELKDLMVNPDFDNACIHVTDNYGDYGIAGFYSVNKLSNKIEHFLFSCRILNLGVEQYIYALLKFPEIDIIPDVAAQLHKKDENPFRINSDGPSAKIVKKNKKRKPYNILLKGGCDLEQVFHYLQHENINVKTEFPFTFKNHHQLRNDCTLCLRHSVELDKTTQNRLAEEVPFLDNYLFETQIYDNDYDVLVLSLLNNYGTVIYKEKNTGIEIPAEHKIFDEMTGKISNFFGLRNIQYDEKLLNIFKEQYEYRGELSPEEFKRNLEFIRQRVSKPIIFINASEIPFQGINELPADARVKISTERIIMMNKVLDDFIAENKNCFLADLRQIIIKDSDRKNFVFQYKREIYIKIADKLLKTLEMIDKSGFKLNRKDFIKAVIFKFLVDVKDKIKFLLSR